MQLGCFTTSLIRKSIANSAAQIASVVVLSTLHNKLSLQSSSFLSWANYLKTTHYPLSSLKNSNLFVSLTYFLFSYHIFLFGTLICYCVLLNYVITIFCFLTRIELVVLFELIENLSGIIVSLECRRTK